MPLFPIFLATCMVAGASGYFFKPGAWYASLDKPSWTPPDWAFPVVWTILYVMIAVAAARVASLPGSGAAIAFWSLQIALNTLWSGVFFGVRRMLAALVLLGCLWLAVLATTIAFWQHDTLAALMMLPYIAWGSYAFALNLSVWWRNRGRELAIA
jgi:tryptophan-rich sensory protein